MPAFIHSISTSVPPFVTSQDKIADFMVANLQLSEDEERKLRVLYRASGIGQRYSVLEDFSRNLNGQSFFSERAFPSAKPRMELYQKNAIKLASEACGTAIKKADITPTDVTHLVAVSCTGMYAPGLDIELIQTLGLQTETERTSINFMGCYAAFNALKTASHIVEANPKSTVMVVCVELCSIHLQDETDDDSLLSNAIFGDGAAAIIMRGFPKKKSLEVMKFHSDLALEGKQEMGWFIGDSGFEMKLSTKVPGVIEAGIEELTDRLLKKTALNLNQISFFAIHPGGKKILEIIEKQLGISKEENAYARAILREYGNMSSPTVLFVLNRIFDGLEEVDHGKYILSFAFGPGLTLESAVLKTHLDA